MDWLKKHGLTTLVIGAAFSGIGYTWRLVERSAMAEAELKLRDKYEQVIIDNIKLSIRCPE